MTEKDGINQASGRAEMVGTEWFRSRQPRRANWSDCQIVYFRRSVNITDLYYIYHVPDVPVDGGLGSRPAMNIQLLLQARSGVHDRNRFGYGVPRPQGTAGRIVRDSPTEYSKKLKISSRRYSGRIFRRSGEQEIINLTTP